MFRAVSDFAKYLFSLLTELFTWLLNGLYTIIRPVIELVAGIFYFIYKIGVVLVKVLELVLMVARLLGGLVAGLFKTIFGFAYSGQPASLPGSYNAALGKIMPIINGSLQLDKVAYILIFGIWITTGFYALKIIGDLRGGVGGD